MRYLFLAVIVLIFPSLLTSAAHADGACSLEVLSTYGYEPEGVVHEKEYAGIYLIYPGKTGKDIERVNIKVQGESISVGMLDMLFNRFDKPVSITGFKVGTGSTELSLSYEVLLPPKNSGEKPVVGCSGSKILKVVKTKKF